MKQYLILIVLGFLIVKCEMATDDRLKTFIPGTYVRFSDHEMRREYDSIRIYLVSESGKQYRLERSTSYQRKLDGSEFPWEHKKEIWVAFYETDTRSLQETKKGKLITFVPDQGILMVGNTIYRKQK